MQIPIIIPLVGDYDVLHRDVEDEEVLISIKEYYLLMTHWLEGVKALYNLKDNIQLRYPRLMKDLILFQPNRELTC